MVETRHFNEGPGDKNKKNSKEDKNTVKNKSDMVGATVVWGSPALEKKRPSDNKKEVAKSTTKPVTKPSSPLEEKQDNELYNNLLEGESMRATDTLKHVIRDLYEEKTRCVTNSKYQSGGQIIGQDKNGVEISIGFRADGDGEYISFQKDNGDTRVTQTYAKTKNGYVLLTQKNSDSIAVLKSPKKLYDTVQPQIDDNVETIVSFIKENPDYKPKYLALGEIIDLRSVMK